MGEPEEQEGQIKYLIWVIPPWWLEEPSFALFFNNFWLATNSRPRIYFSDPIKKIPLRPMEGYQEVATVSQNFFFS